MKIDPRTLDHNHKYPPKYFETIVQNGQNMFALMLYYFESGETFESPIVNMYQNYLRNVIRKEAGGLFAPNSTLGQMLALVMDVLE